MKLKNKVPIKKNKHLISPVHFFLAVESSGKGFLGFDLLGFRSVLLGILIPVLEDLGFSLYFCFVIFTLKSFANLSL